MNTLFDREYRARSASLLMTSRKNAGLHAGLVLAAAIGSLGPATGRSENVGTVTEPLISNQVVDAATRERFTLINLTRDDGYACSGSLLRNDWVVTAAHCIEVTPGSGGPAVPPNTVDITAGWSTTNQESRVDQIVDFRPNDVALLHLASSFAVNGATTGFDRLIFTDGQFPYFGVTIDVPIHVFGRGIYQYAYMQGNTPVPAQSDGQYRVGNFYITSNTDGGALAWFSKTDSAAVDGGDSGGPSFASILEGEALVGVTSAAHYQCLPNQDCSSGWQWVSNTPDAATAPLAPLYNEIENVIGPLAQPPSAPQNSYVGTFGSVQNVTPIWVYAVDSSGNLLWYRKDSADSPWQGANTVGYGWGQFRDVIPAGGNCFYALTADGHLEWYRHDGFSDGSFQWSGPLEVGNGWTFTKVFSGGEGILYAIQSDGTLLWYDNPGYTSGQPNWQASTTVGSGWNQFRDVFSSGQGTIYALTVDGNLLQYQHTGYKTGDASWTVPLTVATGWDIYSKVVAAGNGVLLAIQPDGNMYYYQFQGDEHNPPILLPTPSPDPLVAPVMPSYWQPPVLVGTGWQDMETIFAVLPTPLQQPH